MVAPKRPPTRRLLSRALFAAPRDRENDQQTCDVALDVLLGELGGAGDAVPLGLWPVACAQIERDHLMLPNLRKPIGKNPRAARTRSPSGGASGGVSVVFVGHHGIETVSGAELLLRRTGGSSGKKRPFCDILSQLKLILMHSSALEPPCGARSYELDQKIPAVRWPSKKPLE